MNFRNYILFILLPVFITAKATTFTDEVSNFLEEISNGLKSLDNVFNFGLNKIHHNSIEKVELKFYYECLCPYCIKFDRDEFKPVVEKLNQFLDIQLYPYGNAQTIEKDGEVTFKCQHGPRECYGNKLHACAIDLLQNITNAVLFNSCLMKDRSTDAAADNCAESMSLNSEPIKQCAKGSRGTELLKYYGEESQKANFNYVPYILINGKEPDGDNLMDEICKEFKVLPKPCLKPDSL